MVTLPKKILEHRIRPQTVAIGVSLWLGISSLTGCSTAISTNPQASSAEVENQDSQKEAKTLKSSPTIDEPDSLKAVQDSPIASTPVDEPNSKDVASQASPDEEVLNAQASIEAAAEATTLEMLTLYDFADLQGTPYGQVRDRLMERGWIPHTFAMTTGAESDFRDSHVQAMEGLNYLEVKTCSGTGQGFCQFEFVYQNRTAANAPILSVTTTATNPGDPSNPEPSFWEFRLDERSDLTYVERSFDQSLFAELQQEQSFCLGVGRCEPLQYMLKDALLIASSGGFGTTKMALIPDAPVSKEDAIAYAKILDAGQVIDFETVHPDSELNTEQYYEAGIPQETVAERGGITAVSLQLTPSGRVSEISFSIIVL